MASYIETSKMPNEDIRYQAYLSVWSLAPKFILGALLLGASVLVYGFAPEVLTDPVRIIGMAVLAFIGFFVIGSALSVFYTTEIAVTDLRIIAKVGLIRRQTMDLLLEKVESLQVDQSVFGSMLNFGTITISAAGEENTRINSVAEPIQLKQSYYETHTANKNQQPVVEEAV